MTPKQKKKEIFKYIFFVLTFVVVLVLIAGIIRFIDKLDENNSDEEAVVYVSGIPSEENNTADSGGDVFMPEEQPINLSGQNLD